MVSATLLVTWLSRSRKGGGSRATGTAHWEQLISGESAHTQRTIRLTRTWPKNACSKSWPRSRPFAGHTSPCGARRKLLKTRSSKPRATSRGRKGSCKPSRRIFAGKGHRTWKTTMMKKSELWKTPVFTSRRSKKKDQEIADLLQRAESFDEAIAARKERSDELNKLYKQAESEFESEFQRVQELASSLNDIIDKMRQFKDAIAAQTGRIQDKQIEIQNLTNNIQARKEKIQGYQSEANKYWDRPIATTENPEDVKKRFEKLERDIATKARDHGGKGFFQIEAEWKKAEMTKHAMDTAVKVAEKQLQAIMEGLEKRVSKFRRVRKLIGNRFSQKFDDCLSQNEFSGLINLDYKEKTLIPAANPRGKWTHDSSGDVKQERAGSLKHLSGGERSFATICMLLALSWVSSGPILCLDEFDVFMDEQNRTLSMRNMINLTRMMKDKQTIMITPQAIGMIQQGKDIKKHQLQKIAEDQRPLPGQGSQEVS
mmetsp:Transcript_41224/g.64417  ORF Transcript_41224/g.64417 Transcript_41224/m.64417 type:complete len:485 (-) Transcript_41224:323-1777(-)